MCTFDNPAVQIFWLSHLSVLSNHSRNHFHLPTNSPQLRRSLAPSSLTPTAASAACNSHHLLQLFLGQRQQHRHFSLALMASLAATNTETNHDLPTKSRSCKRYLQRRSEKLICFSEMLQEIVKQLRPKKTDFEHA